MAVANPIYQAMVTALEAIISPRVVSRLLQEGLLQVGKTPETVSYPELETILKTQVYRQLQVAMPVVKAKEAVQGLLEQLAEVARPAASPALALLTLEAQAQELEQLKGALLPFNLYFEWPETQKLRAQLQLLEAEHQAGRTTAPLLESSREQLRLLHHKLEDQLVVQARELSELQAALEVVRSLGGPKVRRLENLVQQIASEQQRRQLAPAEVERARKLATDLRKLMESSVVNESRLPPVPAGHEGGLLDLEANESLQIDVASLDPEIGSRLLLIDVERESHELSALNDEYANLLGFDSALRERVTELQERLLRRQSLGGELSRLRSDLQQAREVWRGRLSRELRDLAQRLERLLPSNDAALAVQVSLSILETTLPAPADIEQARELAALGLEQAEASQAGSALQLKLNQQAHALEQLQRIAKRYQAEAVGGAERARLTQALVTLEGVHSQGHLAPEQVAGARQLAAELEGVVAQQATASTTRQRAEVRGLLHQVEALPILPGLAAASERLVTALKQQLLQLDVAPLAPTELAAAKAWVDKLKHDLHEAFQGELSQMMAQARDLGDTEALSYIQAALAHSESEPTSLSAAQEALAAGVERHRAKQLRELHQLETESRRYAHDPEFAELYSLLQSAKADLAAGQLARGLKHGWSQLDALRQHSTQLAESFLPRLNAALSAFAPLVRLNSDDSHQAGRILNYLDNQREAFSRVSPAMQHELLTSLRQAEELLEVLCGEYEATRAVADQLVSSNAIDDLLGLFDAPSPAPESKPAGRYPALDGWLDSYLNEPSVRCAAAFSASELLAGRLDPSARALGVNPVQAALVELVGRLTQLGNRLALGAPRLLTLELSKQSVVVVQPAPTYLLLIVLGVPTQLSLVLHKLRRELPALIAILRDLSLS